MDQLVEPVGSFGTYQKINLAIVGCVTMLSAMYYNLIIINYIEPNIECQSKRNQFNFTVPEYENYTTCDMWNSHNEYISSDTISPFDCKVNNSTYGINVVNEWNLSCNNNYLATITQSLYLIGTLCAFLTELVVDKYGRRKASVIFILTLIGTAVISQALISDMKMLSVKSSQAKFIIYSVMQPILGIVVYCLSGSTYLHLIELTTSNYHRFFSNANVMFYFAGEVASLAIYYFTFNWKLTNWIFILFAIFTFAMFNFFVLESPRWLIESAQYDEAYEILKKIARFNKKKTLDSHKFKDYLLKQMQTNISDRSRESSDLEDQLDQVNKKPQIEIKEVTFSRRVCLPKDNFIKIALLVILFNCLSINFFGLSLSIVNLTEINKFLVILLSSVFGCLGAFFCSINKKTGHKSALLYFLMLSLLSSIGIILIPDQMGLDWDIGKLACGLIGKAAIVAAYNTAIIFAAESYDRKLKLNLIVLLNCTGCIMTIATPQINSLSFIWKPLPYVIYSVSAFLSYIIVNNLPEPRTLQKKKNLNFM